MGVVSDVGVLAAVRKRSRVEVGRLESWRRWSSRLRQRVNEFGSPWHVQQTKQITVRREVLKL